MSNPKAITRIAFLDYLRIFAFISVLIGHKFYANIVAAIANDKLHATPKLLLELLTPFVFGGGAGVIVFFLVSGYIISQVLSVEQTTSFLIRRVFRIYPLYVIAVLIQIIVQKTWGTLSLNLLVQQLLLIGDFLVRLIRWQELNGRFELKLFSMFSWLCLRQAVFGISESTC